MKPKELEICFVNLSVSKLIELNIYETFKEFYKKNNNNNTKEHDMYNVNDAPKTL